MVSAPISSAEEGGHAPLWTPSKDYVDNHTLSKFATFVARTVGIEVKGDYATLHRWSVQEPAAFWRAVWDFAGFIGEGDLEPTMMNAEALPGTRWFPNLRM